MRRRAPGGDHAPRERVFASLTQALVPPEDSAPCVPAWANRFASIEVVDTRERRHASWGDQSPADHEAARTG
jgi:hypothetical protein